LLGRNGSRTQTPLRPETAARHCSIVAKLQTRIAPEPYSLRQNSPGFASAGVAIATQANANVRSGGRGGYFQELFHLSLRGVCVF
jgi:hypothetical protein